VNSEAEPIQIADDLKPALPLQHSPGDLNHFKTMFEQGTQFSGILSLDGTLVEINRHALNACGFARQQVIGKPFWECGWWNPSATLAETVRLAVKQAVAGKQYRTETKYFVADGSERFVDLTLSPIINDQGQVLFIVAAGVDITDHKWAEKQLRYSEERYRHLADSERAARADAEHASHLKDEFLATVSHELRTPLNAILGWSQILASSATNSPEDLEEGLATIERNARAQARIIEDLLDMSRIINGKVRLDMQRLDLPAIIETAVAILHPAAEAKGIQLESFIDPLRDLSVTGDSNRIQQVLWNLISNAVKFTPRAGRVQVKLEPADSHIRISVTDTGEGIRPEFLPYVFDRFRQSDASITRRHGGLGLGLSIVKQVVELHGGSIRAASDGPGHGSTFTISLPITSVTIFPAATHETGPLPKASAQVQVVDSKIELDGVRVLVVDDEPDARQMVKRVLEARHALVKTTGSTDEAVQLLQDEKFDVLVSDIGMPDEDGYTLIKRVRSINQANRDIPAIALTAYARQEDRVRALAASFEKHVIKPVEPAELVISVADAAKKALH
jgi:PAS domain S-box-containing protein